MSDNDENLDQQTPETPSPYRSEPAGEKMPDFGADSSANAANAPFPATRDTRERAEDDIFGGLPTQQSPAANSDGPRWQPAPASPSSGDEDAKPAAANEELPTVPVLTPEVPSDGQASEVNAEERGDEDNPFASSSPREDEEPNPFAPSASSRDEEAEASPLTARRERRAAEEDLESTQVRRSSLFAPTSEDPDTVAGGALLGGESVVAGDALMDDSPATAQLPANDARYPEDDLFAGEELEAPRSRAWAHVASIFGLLLLTPIAWYLVADAGARFTLPQNAPWTTGQISIPAILELVAGLIVVVLIAILVRSSSVGAWIAGIVLIAAGALFVVTPELTQRLVDQPLDQLSELHTMGANIAHHFLADGSTGRLLAYGLALVLTGYISHSARRAGRREERLQAAYERRGQGR